MKKALIVSPYFDHLGGGERYMLTVASALETLGFAVTLGWDNLEEITHLCSMLNITLRNPTLSPEIKKQYFSRNPLAMWQATKPYDIVVYLSDGSLPLLGGRRNIVHMQVPFHDVRGKSWQNDVKKNWIRAVIVNSQFTKNVIDGEYGIRSVVVYPPVEMLADHGHDKKKIILSVGRFEPSLKAKRQDVLIDAFKTFSRSMPEWELVLAGGCASDAWLGELKTMSKNYPIRFVPNASHGELNSLYRDATIYWHAAGYGIDEAKNPELTEHFGVTTVEAISAGCIPLVVGKGGQREIVTDPTFYWNTREELVEKTKSVIAHPPVLNIDISHYTLATFEESLKKLCL